MTRNPLYFMIALLIALTSCSDKEDPIIDDEPLLPKPTASFTYEVVDPKDPFTIKFTNTSTNYGATRWSFDDDSTSSEASPTHTFLKTGSFVVKLVTVNDEGFWAQREETVRIVPSELMQLVASPSADGLRMSYETDVNVAKTQWFIRENEQTSHLESEEPDMKLDIPDGQFVNAYVVLTTPKGSVMSMNMLLASLGIVRDLTTLDNEFTVSHENGGGRDAGEGSSKLIDNNITTKWFVGGINDSYFYWQFEYYQPQVVNGYSMTSGNDADDRDPKDWDILGSNDGQNWTVLDSRTNENFSSRRLTRIFSFDNATPYTFYRIHIKARKSSSAFQMSEFRMLKLPTAQ